MLEEQQREEEREGRKEVGRLQSLGKERNTFPSLGVFPSPTHVSFSPLLQRVNRGAGFHCEHRSMVVKRNINQAGIPCFPIRSISVPSLGALAPPVLPIRTKRALGQLLPQSPSCG